MMWSLMFKFWYVPVIAVMALSTYAAWQRGNAKAAALKAATQRLDEAHSEIAGMRQRITAMQRRQQKTEALVDEWRTRQKESMARVHSLALTIRNAATDNTAYAACMSDKVKLPDALRDELQAASITSEAKHDKDSP